LPIQKKLIVIENVSNAINQISQTTVRNVVGRFSLDQLLSDTASINEQIKNVIDRHTEPWGTQVTAVEIKHIVLPDNMQRAMAKEAERERRAKIVAAAFSDRCPALPFSNCPASVQSYASSSGWFSTRSGNCRSSVTAMRRMQPATWLTQEVP
jgi:hypothetical protein